MSKLKKHSSNHTHVHLWCTASQQVDERGVEGHDGIAHVHHLLLIVPISRPESREGAGLVKADRSERASSLINVFLHVGADAVDRTRQVQSRSLRDLNGFLHGGQ